MKLKFTFLRKYLQLGPAGTFEQKFTVLDLIVLS